MKFNVNAVSGPNSLSFAERGIEAHRDDWQYQYGGKGEMVNGKRVSDCAGLLYSYFKDIGISGCMGGCTAQVNYNCIFSSKLNGQIPRIHGLTVTMYDSDVSTGLYGHVGIYIGGGEVCDNSTYGTNMVRKGIFERNWTEWHLFDNGLKYPKNGWYRFDNKYVHYTNYEYDLSTVIDGYSIDSKGFAQNVDVELSNEWVSAREVKSYLESQGWQNNGGQVVDFESNATVTGTGVNVRSKSSTSSSVVGTVTKNNQVQVLEAVTGDSISGTNVWYKVRLKNGVEGYILSLYVQLDNEITVSKPRDPYLSVDDGIVYLNCDDCTDIYYTTDCSDPVSYGQVYDGACYDVGCTYKFVSRNEAGYSNVVTRSVCSNGMVFKDFKFTDWFAKKVDKVVTNGLFTGTGNNNFSPGLNMTRGQFVLVLARYLDIDLDGYSGYTNFSDVGTDKFYTEAVNWASENGIVTGIGNNKFAPNSSITREQVCAILVRYFNWSCDEYLEFDDDNKISKWAKDAVYICRYHGIINGVGKNKFDPKGVLSRAQGATIMANL